MTSNLKINTHEWTSGEKRAQETFYAFLRDRSKLITPWYALGTPSSEEGARIFRENVKLGRGGWTPKSRLSTAYDVPIPSRSGFEGLYLRIFEPQSEEKKISREAAGVYLHIHGGGWVIGAADNEDEVLNRIANRTGRTVASLSYRLAPKFPYPAAVEDCIDAAQYLLQPENASRFGPLRVIGGESAGGHLAMCLAFALRKAGVDLRAQLDCLIFNYGCFGECILVDFRRRAKGTYKHAYMTDLGRTPSSRTHTDTLILGPVDIVQFGNAWTRGETDVQIADISPLFEPNFTGMPPAIFLVGDKDALADDSYFAAIKWHMAGNETELVVFPGSYHGFLTVPGPDADAGLSVNEQFIIESAMRGRNRE